MFLLGANMVSELRRSDVNPGVVKWAAESENMSVFLSAITVGELRYGISRLWDREQAKACEAWYESLKTDYAHWILPVNFTITEVGSELDIPDSLLTSDGLIAATAVVHDMVLVTRNIKDFARTEVRLLDPFDSA